MIKTSRFILRLLTRGNADAITIFPFIFLIDPKLRLNKVLINHEKIHIRQQIELLIIPFYIVYFVEYIIGRINKKNHYEAYMNISFEKEAYKNQENLNYLKERKYWNYLRK